MAEKTKLLIVPCSGQETADLADDITTILRDDYEMGNTVDVLKSMKTEDVDKDKIKGYTHPLVGDYFPDKEVKADCGKNELKDSVGGSHVVLVEHLLTPNRPESVNDHYMTVRGFLDLFRSADTLQMSLAVPYLSYVRSHSIEKYAKRGFHQFDSLRRTLKDYRQDGLHTLVTIDPHSIKASQIAEELGLDFHGVNPFQSGRSINPYKLGLSGDKATEVLERLRPFQQRLRSLIEQFPGHIYLICVDDGTERRTENVADRAFQDLQPEDFYAMIAYLDKDRISYAEAPTKFKRFSQINEKNVDPEGIYIGIDDMSASCKTGFNAGKIFKDAGAKRVEFWTTHAVTMPHQYDTANQRDIVDEIVCLDTVPQDPRLKFDFIKASADLLAAELYKAHEKLASSR